MTTAILTTLHAALLTAQTPDLHRVGCLRAAYPTHVHALELDASGRSWVRTSGGRFAWDDGRAKTFDQRLSGPDLQDSMAIACPLGDAARHPVEDEDPGRLRVDAFLKSLYGSTAREVGHDIERVDWMPNHGGKRLRCNGRQVVPPRHDALRVPPIGIGTDYDENVMAAAARRGEGGFHHLTDPAQLAGILEEELRSARSVAGRDAVLTFSPRPGVEVPQLMVAADRMRVAHVLVDAAALLEEGDATRLSGDDAQNIQRVRRFEKQLVGSGGEAMRDLQLRNRSRAHRLLP